MTLLADKLKQAGYATLEAEFLARYTDALKHHNGAVKQAWLVLGQQWGYSIGDKIWSDAKAPAELGDQVATDTQHNRVPHAGRSDQESVDTQAINVAPLPPSRREPKQKQFHDQRLPDADRKKVSAQATALSLFWREMKMNKLRWEQLDGFIREKAMAGANKALASHFEIKQAALGVLIKKHAIPSDPKAFCIDSIKTDDAKRFSEISNKQATLIVTQIVEHNKAEIEDGIRLIAAE